MNTLLLITASFSDAPIYKEIMTDPLFGLWAVLFCGGFFLAFLFSMSKEVPRGGKFFWSLGMVSMLAGFIGIVFYGVPLHRGQDKPLAVSEFEEIIEYASACELKHINQLVDSAVEVTIAQITPVLSKCEQQEKTSAYKHALESVNSDGI